ncbi:hypothetical protein [Fibrella forsythiae]|nr:hypothetical protein [Fibrella forsythiae]
MIKVVNKNWFDYNQSDNRQMVNLYAKPVNLTKFQDMASKQ